MIWKWLAIYYISIKQWGIVFTILFIHSISCSLSTISSLPQCGVFVVLFARASNIQIQHVMQRDEYEGILYYQLDGFSYFHPHELLWIRIFKTCTHTIHSIRNEVLSFAIPPIRPMLNILNIYWICIWDEPEPSAEHWALSTVCGRCLSTRAYNSTINTWHGGFESMLQSGNGMVYDYKTTVKCKNTIYNIDMTFEEEHVWQCLLAIIVIHHIYEYISFTLFTIDQFNDPRKPMRPLN